MQAPWSKQLHDSRGLPTLSPVNIYIYISTHTRTYIHTYIHLYIAIRCMYSEISYVVENLPSNAAYLTLIVVLSVQCVLVFHQVTGA